VVLLLVSPLVLPTLVVPVSLLPETGPVLVLPPLVLLLVSGPPLLLLTLPLPPLDSVAALAELVVGVVTGPEDPSVAVATPVVEPVPVAPLVVDVAGSSEQAVASASAATRERGFEFIASCAPSRARDASGDHRPGRVNRRGLSRPRAYTRGAYASAVSRDALTAG
jgi:hypothetical protein